MQRGQHAAALQHSAVSQQRNFCLKPNSMWLNSLWWCHSPDAPQSLSFMDWQKGKAAVQSDTPSLCNPNKEKVVLWRGKKRWGGDIFYSCSCMFYLSRNTIFIRVETLKCNEMFILFRLPANMQTILSFCLYFDFIYFLEYTVNVLWLKML